MEPNRRLALLKFLPWVIVIGLIGTGIVFWVKVHLPMRQKQNQVMENLWAAGKDAEECEGRLEGFEAVRNELEAEIDSLKVQNDDLRSWRMELETELKRKEQELQAFQKTQTELSQKLQQEIRHGDVLIKQIQGNLVVDVNDMILFDSGAVDLNERGREVLKRVGEALRQATDRMIQVGGHTDSLQISEQLRAKFPSNWELSVARATQVVRFLQEEAKIPGERLTAAGFAQYRPVAPNTSKRGRRLNRRIEIVLLSKLAEK